MMERRKGTVNKKLKRYLDETEKTKEKNCTASGASEECAGNAETG